MISRCGAVGLQNRNIYELYAWHAPYWKRQSRLLIIGLEEALGLGNVKLLGYDFEVLRDYRIAIPLRCLAPPAAYRVLRLAKPVVDIRA